MGKNMMKLDSKDAPPGYASRSNGGHAGGSRLPVTRTFTTGPALQLDNVVATSKFSHPRIQYRAGSDEKDKTCGTSWLSKIGRLGASSSPAAEVGALVKDTSNDYYQVECVVQTFSLNSHHLNVQVGAFICKTTSALSDKKKPTFLPAKMSMLCVPVFGNVAEDVHAGRFKGAAQSNAQHVYHIHGSEFRFDAGTNYDSWQYYQEAPTIKLQKAFNWEYQAAVERSSDLVGFKLIAEFHVHPEGFFDESTAKIINLEININGKAFLQNQTKWRITSLTSRSTDGSVQLTVKPDGSLLVLMYVHGRLLRKPDQEGPVMAAAENAILTSSAEAGEGQPENT